MSTLQVNKTYWKTDENGDYIAKPEDCFCCQRNHPDDETFWEIYDDTPLCQRCDHEECLDAQELSRIKAGIDAMDKVVNDVLPLQVAVAQ